MRTIASIALLVAACAAKAPPASTGPSAPSTGGSTTSSPPAADCVCTMDYNPVCGVDGKTYSNACQAGCAKVAVKANGACK